jgi:UDP-glucose 4-epimerase
MITKKRKILVTGGAGFLGSHIADTLSDDGHEVLIFDTNESPYLRNDQKFIKGDLTDYKNVLEAMKGCDCVYHFGAIADIDDAKSIPRRTLDVNLMGTLNILDAAKENLVKRVMFASTIYVYSESGSFYRVSKHSCELLLQAYQKEFGLDYTILRFGTLYGPRSDQHNSIYRILKQAMSDGVVVHKGDGDEVREYIHVKDASRISVKALEDNFVNEALIITGHHRMKLSEIHAAVKEILGGKLELKYEPHNNKAHYKQTPYSYLPKLGKKLVSNTYTDLGQGLIEVLADIKAPRIEEIRV